MLSPAHSTNTKFLHLLIILHTATFIFCAFNGSLASELKTRRLLKPRQTAIIQFSHLYEVTALPSVPRNKARIHMFDARKWVQMCSPTALLGLWIISTRSTDQSWEMCQHRNISQEKTTQHCKQMYSEGFYAALFTPTVAYSRGCTVQEDLVECR